MIESTDEDTGQVEALGGVNPKDVRRAMEVLLRRKPGRHPELPELEFAEEAASLSDSGWTSRKIAQHKIPEDYAQYPLSAGAEVRSALKSYRERPASKKSELK
jgi:hypothetical protein